MEKGTALKSLNILHKTLLMGQLIFAAIAVFLVYTKTINAPLTSMDKALQVIAILFAVGGFSGGAAIFKKKLIQIREMQTDASEKFEVYRSASIIQWTLLEAPCIFSILSFILTGNYAFLALSFVLILLFTVLNPEKTKISLQAGISESALDEL
jgi:hypothetical protein